MVTVKPAGQGKHEGVKRLYDMGHDTNSFPVILLDNTIIRVVQIVAPYRAAAASINMMRYLSGKGL